MSGLRQPLGVPLGERILDADFRSPLTCLSDTQLE
jgi:hypothetical protein